MTPPNFCSENHECPLGDNVERNKDVQCEDHSGALSGLLAALVEPIDVVNWTQHGSCLW
jgi:hypothetical protein